MKLDRRYWKKLSERFNEFTRDSWRRQTSRIIKVEQTGFFPAHVGLRGLNHNESKLLDFQTKYIEAKEIFFAGGMNEYGLDVYINSSVHSSRAGTYIEMKRNGTIYRGDLYDTSDSVPYFFQKCIPLHELFSEEYVNFIKDAKSKSTHENGEKLRTDEYWLRQRFEKEHAAHKVNDLFQSYAQIELKERLEKAGIKILVFFRFTHKVESPSIPHSLRYIGSPEYVRPIKGGIEIGWLATGTYNSLPHVVRITRSKEIPNTQLMKIGLETSGYYSHHQNCSIPKNQVSKAKAFFKRRFDKIEVKGER